ncbi:SDR family oxidoreductase [Shinella pollutisoli]|uniref:3-dehydrosphinganine reductase n=1 Tax=Shinella pollutisoli TaxID=2250594 RepID=A0ABV7DC05_9HYPH|nr:SDR family oxidoreductase [Shinella pollutisoli]
MRHVLVTGGSSGIGLAIAALLLSRGDRVTLLARDEGRLEAAMDILSELPGAGERLAAVSADVADAASVGAGVRAAASRFGPADVLVASAGIVEPGLFHDQPPELFERQVAVNLFGVANSVRAVLPDMRAAGGGRIAIVSSGAGLIGIPGYSGYCASKFALRGLAASLRAETAGHGISVSISFPPDTVTPQYEREMLVRPPEAEAMMGRVRPWQAADVARVIVEGMEKGRREVHFGVALRFVGYFGPLVSAWFDARLVRTARKGRRPV